MAILTGMRLVIFDVDGTLVRPFTDELRPGVADWFDAWRFMEARPLLALASNQGGVGLRLHRERMGQDMGEYPTQAETEVRLERVARRLWIRPSLVFISFAYQFGPGRWTETPMSAVGDVRWGRNWRMPNPGMLLAAMATARATPLETLAVGGETLQGAARRCGVGFAWNGRFFEMPQMVLV